MRVVFKTFPKGTLLWETNTEMIPVLPNEGDNVEIGDKSFYGQVQKRELFLSAVEQPVWYILVKEFK